MSDITTTIRSLLPAEQVAALRTAREQVTSANLTLAALTEGKSRAETKLRELTSVSATRGAAVAQSFVDGSSALALPDNQGEVDDVRLAVATLGDQIVAATSSLNEWQGRVTFAEVGLLKALQASVAKHYAECADHMTEAFAVLESTHRLLEVKHRQPSVRPPAWQRFAIPAPDHNPRRFAPDGCAWGTTMARESGACARATEALQELIAE